MKAYKIKEDINKLLTKDRLLMPWENQLLLLATPVEPQYFITNDLKRFAEKIEEVDLMQEKWVHPHLWKPIKAEVYK